MKKTIILGLVMSVCLLSVAAIKYFTDYPNNGNPPTSYAIPMDTLNHAAGQVPYNYITVGQLLALVPGSIDYDTNETSLAFVWPGPTNSVQADNGYHYYSTSGNFSFTNINAAAGSNLWSTITVSNSSASSVTGFVAITGARLYNGSNAPVIPSGKTAIFSFLVQSTYLTNYQDAVQSN